MFILHRIEKATSTILENLHLFQLQIGTLTARMNALEKNTTANTVACVALCERLDALDGGKK